MEVLDNTIVNVSIPNIAGSLGATISEGTLVISLYGLASAIAIPLTSFLSKYFGVFKVYIGAVLLFTILSFFCGLANSMTSLEIFRFLQGFFSGPMVPLSQAILMNSYPPSKRGLGLAFFVMTIIIAPICGPILGGVITDNFGWRWLFYINIPVGLISALLMTTTALKSGPEEVSRPPVDYVGMLLLFIGVGALQLMLDHGNDYDWFHSNFITVLGITAVIGISLLVIWELTDEHPAIDLSLYKNYNYVIGTICIACGMFCFFGSVVIFPLWLQIVKGYNATWAGLATAPIGIMPFFLSPILGMMLHKLNIKMVVTFGFLVFSVTMFWQSTFTSDTPFSSLVWPRLIQGIGVSCFFLPLNQLALSTIKPHQMVSATSLYNFVRAITSSIATAVVIFIWQRSSTRAHSDIIQNVSNAKVGTQDYLRHLDSIGIKGTAAYNQINAIVTSEASTISTEHIFNIMGIIFLFITFLVWFARVPKKGLNHTTH